MNHSRVTTLTLLMAVTVLSATMIGCSASDPATCVPQIAVVPETPVAGQIVEVTTTTACPVQVAADERFAVRIRPEESSVPIAQAFVTPDDDGAFRVSIQVPSTMGAGSAVATIENYWDVVDCPAAGGCTVPAQVFEVRT